MPVLKRGVEFSCGVSLSVCRFFSRSAHCFNEVAVLASSEALSPTEDYCLNDRCVFA